MTIELTACLAIAVDLQCNPDPGGNHQTYLYFLDELH